jgi:hypothetical protein
MYLYYDRQVYYAFNQVHLIIQMQEMSGNVYV